MSYAAASFQRMLITAIYLTPPTSSMYYAEGPFFSKLCAALYVAPTASSMSYAWYAATSFTRSFIA